MNSAIENYTAEDFESGYEAMEKRRNLLSIFIPLLIKIGVGYCRKSGQALRLHCGTDKFRSGDQGPVENSRFGSDPAEYSGGVGATGAGCKRQD